MLHRYGAGGVADIKSLTNSLTHSLRSNSDGESAS